MVKPFLDWENDLKTRSASAADDIETRLGMTRKEFSAAVQKWKEEQKSKSKIYHKNIIVVDIETTGLNIHRDMIVEIGLCFLDLSSGKIYPIMNVICQEKDKRIDKYDWIFCHSDLTIEQVLEAPYLSDFRDELQGIFDLGFSITAFNQDFDLGFLSFRGFTIKKRFWDPMKKLSPILKIRRNYYSNDYKWPSVQEAYDFFFPDSNYREAHRALDDAMHEAKIIFETYKLIQNRRDFNGNKRDEGMG